MTFFSSPKLSRRNCEFLWENLFFGKHLRVMSLAPSIFVFGLESSVFGKSVLGLGLDFFLFPWSRAFLGLETPPLTSCSPFVVNSSVYLVKNLEWQQTLKPHLHGRLFCNAIRRFFMRENLSRKAVTHTRQDSLAAIAFDKNRCRVSNTCDLRCRLYFCATRCNNRSRP